LTPITGIQPQFQKISIRPSSESQEVIARLENENQTLESYGLREWNCIHVSRSLAYGVKEDELIEGGQYRSHSSTRGVQ